MPSIPVSFLQVLAKLACLRGGLSKSSKKKDRPEERPEV